MPSAIVVRFADGSSTERVEVAYPLGRPARREECTPALLEKFEWNLRAWFPAARAERILARCLHRDALSRTTVPDFLELFGS